MGEDNEDEKKRELTKGKSCRDRESLAEAALRKEKDRLRKRVKRSAATRKEIEKYESLVRWYPNGHMVQETSDQEKERILKDRQRKRERAESLTIPEMKALAMKARTRRAGQTKDAKSLQLTKQRIRRRLASNFYRRKYNQEDWNTLDSMSAYFRQPDTTCGSKELRCRIWLGKYRRLVASGGGKMRDICTPHFLGTSRRITVKGASSSEEQAQLVEEHKKKLETWFGTKLR